MKEWGDCVIDGVPTLKCLEVVFGNMLFLANALIIMVLFVMFVIGSFTYLTSLGEPEKIQKARSTFMWAIIGLVVYVSAFLILRIVDILFLDGSGTLFDFKLPGLNDPPTP